MSLLRFCNLIMCSLKQLNDHNWIEINFPWILNYWSCLKFSKRYLSQQFCFPCILFTYLMNLNCCSCNHHVLWSSKILQKKTNHYFFVWLDIIPRSLVRSLFVRLLLNTVSETCKLIGWLIIFHDSIII